MLSLRRWFAKGGEYANIHGTGAIHPDMKQAALRAIRSGRYEDRGTRDDGALILVTRTEPPLLVLGKVRSKTRDKPDLFLLYSAELRDGHRFNEA